LPWAIVLGPLGVDVDPLVIAAELGEGVDVGLGDRAPIARADLLADHRLHPVNTLNLCSWHPRQSILARCPSV
jgi:hypothetical protein